MGKMETYQDLEVWKQTKDLVRLVYEITKNFPREEQYGLTSQIRRAAVSIPTNIAEGCGRNHTKDSIQFFFVSRGSLYEVETQIFIARDLDFISTEEQGITISRIKSCKRLLNGFINYFQSRGNQQLSTINEQLIEYGNNNEESH